MTPDEKLDLFVNSFLSGMSEERKADLRTGKPDKIAVDIFDTIFGAGASEPILQRIRKKLNQQ